MHTSGTATGDRTPPGRKSVLFCANCGHESAVDGDWVLHERRGSGSVWYQCPECSRAVSVRPTRSLEDATLPSPIAIGRGRYGDRGPSSDADLWSDVWRTYSGVTRAWLTPWRSANATAD